MKRTIASARTVLEHDLAPTLNDHAMRDHQQVLAAAETEARRIADQRIAAQEERVLSVRDAALRALTDARDELDRLRNIGASGRLSAVEYQARLNALRQQQVQAEGHLAKCEEQVEVIAEIEADPVAYYDSLCERQPALMRTFPW